MSLGALFKLSSPDHKPGEPAQLLFSGARIPRDTFQVMRLADDVLREAERSAAQLREQAATEVASQKEQARQQGFAQGRAEAMAAVLGTLEVERRLRELLSHRLSDIVEHCLRNMLGELGESQLMRQRVLHMLHKAASGPVSNGSGWDGASTGVATLYVCPEQLRMVQEVVSMPGPDNIGGLLVVADDRRAPNALLLETRVCFIESNLELTIGEARELVQQALAHAMQALGDCV